MSKIETSMGGSREAFPETAWSSVLSCADPASPERRKALNRLCELYWRPVYRYIRASWGRSVEDAKEAAQEFFCDILDADLVSRYRPSQGRFRDYLKGALRLFHARLQREGLRLRTGGGRTVLSLDVEGMEASVQPPETAPQTPEELFDRQWSRDVLSRALERLERSLTEEGKGAVYRIYEVLELRPVGAARPSYEDVARAEGISVPQVSNHFHEAKGRLRRIILEDVAQYVASPEELDQEIRDLFPA